MADRVSATVLTQSFVLSYPTLMTPEPYKENGKPKAGALPEYSFEAISTQENLDSWEISNPDTGETYHGGVEKLMVKLAKEMWGSDFDVKAAVHHKGLSWPIKNGTAKADSKGSKAEHYRDKKYWRAHAKDEINGRKNLPRLYEGHADGTLTELFRSTEAGKDRIADLFYGGAVCTAELNIVASESPQTKYITFYFSCIVFEENGERLGGKSMMEMRRGISGGKTDYDPTGEMSPDLEDDIPF